MYKRNPPQLHQKTLQRVPRLQCAMRYLSRILGGVLIFDDDNDLATMVTPTGNVLMI